MPVNRAEVVDAAIRIKGLVRATPVLKVEDLDAYVGCQLFLKGEHLQVSGSFKFRGATNAVRLLAERHPDAIATGVATDSSGNHGAALTRAAFELGIPAFVVMPRGASPAKRALVRRYGGQIIDCAPSDESRKKALERVIQETKATEIPSANHPWIIAGAGTAALELVHEVRGLDAVVVPVGGGGLLAGTALALRSRPRIRVLGAEPAGAADAVAALEIGHLVDLRPRVTIADGLLVSLKQLPFEIIKSSSATILPVEDDQLLEALGEVWSRTKQLIEPSSAIAVALVRHLVNHRVLGPDSRVGVIISGGNAAIRLARSRPLVYS